MLIGVAAFLLMLIALLAIPVSLTFRMSLHQAFQGAIDVQWAFGLVRMRIPVPRQKEPPAHKEESDQRPARSKRSPRKGFNVFGAIRQERFRQRIWKFVKELWRAVQKKDIAVHVRLGLGDPADTGRLWAVVGPFSGVLATLQDASIMIEPDFSDAVLEFDGSGNIRLMPLQLVALGLALLFSPPVWHGLNQMRATRQ